MKLTVLVTAAALAAPLALPSPASAVTFSVTKVLQQQAREEQAKELLYQQKSKSKKRIIYHRTRTWLWQDKAGVERTKARVIGWGYSLPLMQKIERLWIQRKIHARQHYIWYRRVQARRAAAAAASSHGTGVWDALAVCESSGDWAYNGPSGFDGGLQFLPSTWSGYKLPGYPAFAYQASREQQIAVAERVLAAAGWSQWPRCSAQLGLT